MRLQAGQYCLYHPSYLICCSWAKVETIGKYISKKRGVISDVNVEVETKFQYSNPSTNFLHRRTTPQMPVDRQLRRAQSALDSTGLPNAQRCGDRLPHRGLLGDSAIRAQTRQFGLHIDAGSLFPWQALVAVVPITRRRCTSLALCRPASSTSHTSITCCCGWRIPRRRWQRLAVSPALAGPSIAVPEPDYLSCRMRLSYGCSWPACNRCPAPARRRISSASHCQSCAAPQASRVVEWEMQLSDQPRILNSEVLPALIYQTPLKMTSQHLRPLFHDGYLPTFPPTSAGQSCFSPRDNTPKGFQIVTGSSYQLLITVFCLSSSAIYLLPSAFLSTVHCQPSTILQPPPQKFVIS